MAEIANIVNTSWQKKIRVIIAASGLLAIIIFLYAVLPVGSDFSNIYIPATEELISGQSPYTVEGYYNPPWTLLFFLPLVPLPAKVASFVITILHLSTFGIVAYKFGAKPLTLALFLFSPPTLYGAMDPNIDWLVALGLILPNVIGIFFIMLKPQLGLPIAIFYGYCAWKSGGVGQVLKLLLPITLAFILSILFYGNWFAKSTELFDVGYNFSVWPTGIIVGLVLLAHAIRKNNRQFAILASPFFSPYVAGYSLGLPVLGLLPMQVETVAAIIGLWIVQFLNSGPL